MTQHLMRQKESVSFCLIKTVVMLMLMGSATCAYAAGLNIPLGSTLNVNSGTLNVAGDVTIAGTLQLTTGTINLTGSWTNSGTFTAGTGTVNLNGASGTQLLNSGGTGSGKLFYHLSHTGTSTVQTNTNPLDINGNFTNSAGIFDANGLAIAIAGNWSNSGTFTANGNTVTMDGSSQSLIGMTTFYNLLKTVSSAATLTFDNTGTQTIVNNLTMYGVSGQLLAIRSDSTPNQSSIALLPGGTQELRYLDVKDSDASGGLTLVAGPTSTNSGNNINWVFDGATLTWDGSASTDWDTAANWNLGLVPRSSDTVIIPNVVTKPILGSSTTVNNLTINSGANLQLAGKSFTISTALNNSGTIELYGSEAVNIASMNTDAGTVVYLGDGDVTAETFTIAGFGIAGFYNLTINDSHAITDVFQTNAALPIAGNLNVTAGTLDVSTNANTLTTTGTLNVNGGTLLATGGNINADGAVNIASGTLTAPGVGGTFTIAGSWTKAGGAVFSSSGGTVTFDTTAASTITGSTNFNNFTCTTGGKQFIFTAGTTQTINGILTLTGVSGNLITLRSTSPSNIYTITDAGTEAVSFVDVQDSTATNSIVAYNSTNSGNNTNWLFSTLSITIPQAGKTVGQTPTVIGRAGASDSVEIKDKDGTTVVTTTADANGNFRVAVSTPLALGANSLTPYVGSISGATVGVTVVASPTSSQVPTIASPLEGATVRGSRPTITGTGNPGSTVTLTANDANGNLLLTDVATTTVDALGNYTISSSDYTTSLVKGTNYLSVTVEGVASSIRTIVLADPFGVIFDSVSNNPIQGAVVTIFTSAGVQCVPGVQIAATDSNPQTTGTDGAYSFSTINGNYYMTVSASGYTFPSTKTTFPAGRSIVTGSKGEVFTISGPVIEMDLPMDVGAVFLKISKSVNKKEVQVGNVVTYAVSIQNSTASSISGAYLEDQIPAGFKYVSGRAILDNAAISDPTGNRPLTFNIGTVSAGQERTLKYQLVVGSGVTFGNYENSARMKYLDGTLISNTASATVKVVPSVLFDLGTVIGKVFWDRNGNGVQDAPQKAEGEVLIEEPIPNVQIVTEEGTLITTDKDGKFHLAAVVPGRHVLRIDERTLPQGALLTTDKAVIVDITPGLLAKVNFGVDSEDRGQKTEDSERRESRARPMEKQKLPVKIIQQREKPIPRLNVSLFQEELVFTDGKLSEPAEFRIFTNYSSFMEKWKLEILDKDTKALVRRFEGRRSDLAEPIYWDGYSRNRKPPKEDRNYVYVLTVTGRDGKQDATKERELKVIRESGDQVIREKTEEELKKQRENWLEQESKVDNLDQQNINIEGETIKIHNGTLRGTVRVMRSGRLTAEIPILPREPLSPSELLKDASAVASQVEPIDIILPTGEYDIHIVPQESNLAQDIGPRTEDKWQVIEDTLDRLEKGQMQPQPSSQHIKVGEDYLFFVGMGDAKMGYIFNRGDIEPVRHDDKFKKGFWSEGKLAYYLKGKIKGKYLITSSLDTERDKKELFRNLDLDQYYPIYGDSSSVNYSATNTQGPLYLLIEWDKSSALWGNYNVAFSDTEFASFSRTLYGAQLHYETVSTTQFGEPKTKLIVFKARAKQRTSHNEFLGTGGSLYYLKNKNVVEGSDKVRIEVRDKITGLVLASKEMREDTDYEMDYANGRIVFWRPVSQLAESESIISSHLLGGNPVYVVADYEYETEDKYDEGATGGRIQQSLTDYVRIGGTYVREDQLNKNFELRGLDSTFHIGRDIQVMGEYAQSRSEAFGSFISTDGGLTFTDLATADLDKGKAYGLKGQAHLFDGLGLTSYYKRIGKGFSSASTISQQGKELMGVGLLLDLTPQTRVRVSHDIQKLIDDGTLQTQSQVGAQKTETTMAQIAHELDKFTFTGEYRHQKVTEKKEQFASETNKEADTAAFRADYRPTDKLTLALEQQATLKGSPNHQTSAIVNAELNKYISMRAKETIGTQGTAMSIGASARALDNFELSSDYTRSDDKSGGASNTVSLGGRAKVDEKTEVHTTLALADTSGGSKTQSVVFGSKRKINDELEMTSDRTYAKSGDQLSQSQTHGLVREKDGKKLEGTLTRQSSQSDTAVSNTNILGLSGDINDKWAAFLNLERGGVQNLDGTSSKRNAGAMGLSFVDRDPLTQEVEFKASSKLELRFDQGQEDVRQLLSYNTAEAKIGSQTTFFAKANISQTENTTTNSTQARYKELAAGFAYRPVHLDRLNLLGRYTYLEDDSPASQSDIHDIEKEKSHILAGEAVYDLTDNWQLVEKLAYKMTDEKIRGFEFTKTQTWLWVNRINYNINGDWQVGAEYRQLTQKEAQDTKQGALVEVARKIGEFLQMGLGYNFTDFNDDLTHLDYTAQGPFVRLTGKFYDRTPEEIELARQKWIEKRIQQWAWQLVNQELAKPGGIILEALYNCFYLAEKAHAEGRLLEAKEFYNRVLQIGESLYREAEEYLRDRLELEKRLKEYDSLARSYYKEGKLEKAKELWQKVITESEPADLKLEF